MGDGRDPEAERFSAYLKRAHAEVSTWPAWRRNVLGPHYSDRMAAKAAEESRKMPDADVAGLLRNEARVARECGAAFGSLPVVVLDRAADEIEARDVEAKLLMIDLAAVREACADLAALLEMDPEYRPGTDTYIAVECAKLALAPK